RMVRRPLLAGVVAFGDPQVEIGPLPDTLDELERLGKVMQRVDEDDGEANPYLVKHVEQDEASGAEGRHDREAARLEVLHRLRKEAFQREPVQGRGEARSPPRRQPGFERWRFRQITTCRTAHDEPLSSSAIESITIVRDPRRPGVEAAGGRAERSPPVRADSSYYRSRAETRCRGERNQPHPRPEVPEALARQALLA